MPTVQNDRIIPFSAVSKFCNKYILLHFLLRSCLSASEKIAVVYNYDLQDDNIFNIFKMMFSPINGLEKYQYLIIKRRKSLNDTENSMQQYSG